MSQDWISLVPPKGKCRWFHKLADNDWLDEDADEIRGMVETLDSHGGYCLKHGRNTYVIMDVDGDSNNEPLTFKCYET